MDNPSFSDVIQALRKYEEKRNPYYYHKFTKLFRAKYKLEKIVKP